MAEPVVAYENDTPGYGMVGVPRRVADGSLWVILVRISEGEDRSQREGYRGTAWRYTHAFWRFDLAIGFAELAARLVSTKHTAPVYILEREIALAAMRHFYIEFYTHWVHGASRKGVA